MSSVSWYVARNLPWGGAVSEVQNQTKQFTLGIGPGLRPNLGEDQINKKKVFWPKLGEDQRKEKGLCPGCDRVLRSNSLPFQSQTSRFLISYFQCQWGRLFLLSVQKSVSKVLKTGYFANSAC